MPYPITPKGDKFCVNGKCYDDRAKALAYQRALYANVPDAKKKEMDELLSIPGTKCWDSWDDDNWYPAMPKLDPKDSRVLYDPLGGTKTKACANCAWFRAGQDTCEVVAGPILPTGLSGLWLEKKDYEPPAMKVEVVNPGMLSGKELEESAKEPTLTETFLQQVKDLIVKTLGRKENEDVKSGFKVLPDNKWVAFYTNNFADREEEIFSEKSHDQYIAWVDSKQLPMPELWHWHLPVRHGVAEWVGRIGHVMMAVGRFDDTPEAAAFKEYYSKNEMQLSHGYYYPKFAKKEGVYDLYATFEISTLPKGRESNPYTTFQEVKEMSDAIRPDKAASLTTILGKELAAKYLGDATKLSKEIEDMGIRFKEATDGAFQDTELRTAVKEIAEVQISFKEALAAFGEKIAKDLKEVTDQVAANEKARDVKIDEMYKAVETAFKLQPSPRLSTETVIPADNPLLVELKKKQAEQGVAASSGGIFDLFGLNAMANGTPEVTK